MAAVIDWLRALRDLGETKRAAGEWGDSSIPSWSSQALSASGALVTNESAVGISAVAEAIRQPAVLIAGLPLDVYDVSPDRRIRTLATGKWQNRFLDKPDEMCSGFDFWSDLSSHVDGYSNAYALKFRSRGRVESCALLDPGRIKVKVDRETRRRTFCFRREASTEVEIAASEIIHVRGWDPDGRPQARSPIERHRDAIGKTNARSKMEERFLANDARPGVVIKMPANVTREQAAEFLDLWNERHRANPGKPNILGGGADIMTLPVSFRDAQFVESEKFAITDLARIFNWPVEYLGGESTRPYGELTARMAQIYLMPRIRRIESAFGDDPDLFGPTSKFRPYFDVSELLRGDFQTTSSTFKELKQAGIITANEGRLPLGWPPIQGGDELQETPVGGAPNQDQPAQDEPAPDPPPAE